MQDPNQTQNPNVQAPVNPAPVVDAQHVNVTPQPISAGVEKEPILTTTLEAPKQEEIIAEVAPSHTPEVSIPVELQSVVEKGPDSHQPIVMPQPPVMKTPAPVKEQKFEVMTPSGPVTLPMTYAQALEKKNTTTISDSLHWLSAMIVYQWRKYDPDHVREVTENMRQKKVAK